MAIVFVPALLRDLTEGHSEVQIPGENVREVIVNLDVEYPGVKEHLCRGDSLAPSLSVFVDGRRAPMGMLQPVGEHSEVHFLSIVEGG